jgi:hypothetical protein
MKRAVTFRIDPADLAELDRQATLHRLNRTEYLIGKALDRLDDITVKDEVADITRRLERLERHVELAGGY